MLDTSKANYFKYDMEDVLKASPTPPEHHSALIQSMWAKGSRIAAVDARMFLQEKAKEGIVDRETQERLLRIIERYSTWR